jgi:hypothetical protein
LTIGPDFGYSVAETSRSLLPRYPDIQAAARA